MICAHFFKVEVGLSEEEFLSVPINEISVATLRIGNTWRDCYFHLRKQPLIVATSANTSVCRRCGKQFPFSEKEAVLRINRISEYITRQIESTARDIGAYDTFLDSSEVDEKLRDKYISFSLRWNYLLNGTSYDFSSDEEFVRLCQGLEPVEFFCFGVVKPLDDLSWLL